MTYDEKRQIVINQLRADRDRLQNLVDSYIIKLKNIREQMCEEKNCAYADFERYKVEYLGQDWEDVSDSLPQDDYRYGMERCIEIIDIAITELKGETYD